MALLLAAASQNWNADAVRQIVARRETRECLLSAPIANASVDPAGIALNSASGCAGLLNRAPAMNSDA